MRYHFSPISLDNYVEINIGLPFSGCFVECLARLRARFPVYFISLRYPYVRELWSDQLVTARQDLGSTKLPRHVMPRDIDSSNRPTAADAAVPFLFINELDITNQRTCISKIEPLSSLVDHQDWALRQPEAYTRKEVTSLSSILTPMLGLRPSRSLVLTDPNSSRPTLVTRRVLRRW